MLIGEFWILVNQGSTREDLDMEEKVFNNLRAALASAEILRREVEFPYQLVAVSSEDILAAVRDQVLGPDQKMGRDFSRPLSPDDAVSGSVLQKVLFRCETERLGSRLKCVHDHNPWDPMDYVTSTSLFVYPL